MSDRLGLAVKKRDRVFSWGKPGGQDKSHEVRAGWGMVFLKPFNMRARGVLPADRLLVSLEARRAGLSRTSWRPK